MPSPTPNPPSTISSDGDTPSNVVDIMATLRGPDGCPWDREQTPESLKPYLLEEVYEVLEAIDGKDPLALKEELGDLLLQILFHSQIAAEEGLFSYQDVKQELGQKLIRRHPHVFKKQHDQTPTTSQEVLRQWEHLKQEEKGNKQETHSVLGTIPKTLPALQRALQVQKRASHVGFDWKTIEPVLQKFKEELDELFTATTKASQGSSSNLQPTVSVEPQHSNIEEELGDVLFSLVNVSRFLRINPEEALRRSTNKFIKRFQYVEDQAKIQGRPVKEFTPEKLDQWWEEAKMEDANTWQTLPAPQKPQHE